MNKRVPFLEKGAAFCSPFEGFSRITIYGHHMDPAVTSPCRVASPVEVGSDTLLFGVGALLDLLAAGLCLKYL